MILTFNELPGLKTFNNIEKRAKNIDLKRIMFHKLLKGKKFSSFCPLVSALSAERKMQICKIFNMPLKHSFNSKKAIDRVKQAQRRLPIKVKQWLWHILNEAMYSVDLKKKQLINMYVISDKLLSCL